ncbi:hypothetical protein BDP27DRAFT_1420882 [Rhodocollybia butyracea]|uniref:Gfd2/YDR514C-like C-terminal domain-containing protein n=1 Tax=Rhodocollybia butyracea TaxID=206335 RepID=A0A9P5PT72_9AGAR|nr:hypothetical protein BDP27DRAFT_1420882 [Rhodocollybia butyracea]
MLDNQCALFSNLFSETNAFPQTNMVSMTKKEAKAQARRKERSEALETLQQAYNENRVITAIDFEWISFDKKEKIMTEFGWSTLSPHDTQKGGHIIVEEWQTKHNPWCESHCYLYEWGTVEVVTQNEIGRKIKEILANIHMDAYIFHGAKEDVDLLNKLKITLDKPILDTLLALAAKIGKHESMESLATACNVFNIAARYLHNAGNDVHFTVLVGKVIAEQEVSDHQVAMARVPKLTPVKPVIPNMDWKLCLAIFTHDSIPPHELVGPSDLFSNTGLSIAGEPLLKEGILTLLKNKLDSFPGEEIERRCNIILTQQNIGSY